MSVALMWFRQDLRLADNPALRAAANGARHVVPIYIWSPEEEGHWPPGGATRWWLQESLRQLERSLQDRGSALILRRGPTLQTVLELIQSTGATQVYWNRRYEPAALQVETQLASALATSGIAHGAFHASRLIEPGSLTNSSGSPYQVFTPFWRAFLAQAKIAAPQASPRQLPGPTHWPASLPLDALGLAPRATWHQRLSDHWTPGESAARAALRKFVEQRLPDYADTRDRPDLPGASRLSPYLRHGELSPHQVWAAVTAAEQRRGESVAGSRAGKFLAELIWREFATQQLVLHPALPDQPRNAQFERLAWRRDDAEFKRWSLGNSGLPLVDAGMRELWQTGWLHNRVRMVAASFLVKNLLHRWQDGERWFWDTLVDADLASNALNWQWVAGTSPDAAPWFRIFNPETQAQKFDPDASYRHRFVPEMDGANYSAPLVNLKLSRQRALDAYTRLKRV
jgi:deoxyribodipyrimidine photo-lyase